MQANWVSQAVSVGGIGDLTLGGADSGYITLANAVPVGVPFTYEITDGSDKEIGIGHLSATTTLVRDYVRATLVSGTYTATSATAITVTTAAKVTIPASAHGLHEAPARIVGESAAERRQMLVRNNSMASYPTSALTANFLYAFPVYWQGGRPIANLYAEVTTAAAGQNIRIGLYPLIDNLTALPLLTATENISVASVGMVSGAVTPVDLPPGWYLGVIASSGTPTIRHATQSIWDAPFGYHATTAYRARTRIQQNFTYAALPAVHNLTVSSSSWYGDSLPTNPAIWAGE